MTKTTTLASLALLSVLSGCGGGSDSEGLTPDSNTNSWNAGVFASASQFKGQCQASNEKNWLRSWSNETYLWYDEIIDRDPALTRDVSEYFALLKTEQMTDSGAKKDNFHSNLPTAEWKAQSQSGVTFGYGFKIKLICATAPRQGVISYTEPNTPASNQNLARGFEIVRSRWH